MNEKLDKALLHAEIDGALTADEAASLQRRLAADSSARDYANELKRLTGLVEDLGTEEPPPAFTNEVMRLVEARPLPSVGWLSRLAAPWRVVIDSVSGGATSSPGRIGKRGGVPPCSPAGPEEER